jgi:hypothetical protein
MVVKFDLLLDFLSPMFENKDASKPQNSLIAPSNAHTRFKKQSKTSGQPQGNLS